ncbi:MAG: WecB/TagA/CpsF family glycosyltransferase [Solirubrobacterales bacterium]|nr:WecB/TagA/CpsF family glycosyltransferase [Solirubrobacterales bacterium]
MGVAGQVELMGLRFDALTDQQAIAHVLRGVESGRGGWVCTANLEILRRYHDERGLRALVDGASLVLADGLPVVWASRLAGTPLPERVAGSGLLWTLPERAAEEGRSVFLLGGNPGAAEATAVRLLERYPALRVAGTHCPPFGFEKDPRELTRISAALAAGAPDIVFVALGFPKQERLIDALRREHPAAWFIPCGIAFSYVSGEVRQAPLLMQRMGLEWLLRLVQEPRRLVRRYLVNGLPFAVRLAIGAWSVRRS